MNKEEKLKCGIICFLLFIIITSIVYCSMNKKEGLQNINTRTLLEKFDKQLNLLNKKLENLDKIDEIIKST
tara:strand:+ start:227 stop:439 length:213 start_codon:yes stop_codon:yes gene_type:complete